MSELITIEENGHRVTGLVLHRSRRFIEVQLAARDGTLKTSLTVPLFAAAHVSLLDEEGDRCAIALLQRLRQQAEFLGEHRAALKALWQEIDERLFELNQTHSGSNEAALTQKRKRHGRQFADGRLSQRDYQRALKLFRKFRAEFEDQRDELVAMFMGPWFVGLELAQVLAVLDSPQSEERRQ